MELQKLRHIETKISNRDSWSTLRKKVKKIDLDHKFLRFHINVEKFMKNAKNGQVGNLLKI